MNLPRPGKPPVSVLVAHEVWRSRGLKALIALGMTVFALAGVVNFLGVLDRFREPYVVTASRLLTHSPVPAGVTSVEVEYDVDRRRLCSTDLVSFFSELPSGSVVARRRDAGGTTDLGRHTIRNRVEFPPALRRGLCYRHNVRVVSECTSSTVFNFAAPPVEFCLEAPP